MPIFGLTLLDRPWCSVSVTANVYLKKTHISIYKYINIYIIENPNGMHTVWIQAVTFTQTDGMETRKYLHAFIYKTSQTFRQKTK